MKTIEAFSAEQIFRPANRLASAALVLIRKTSRQTCDFFADKFDF